MTTECVDLVLDTGELVRIECPGEHFDALYDALEHKQKIKDNFVPDMFDGCTAEFLGNSLSRVNMARVVGML